MKKKIRRYFLKGVPVWLQALMLAMVSLIVLFFVAATLGQISFFSENIGEPGAYALHAVVLGVGCFFICRQYPKSTWYVPLIANLFVFLSAAIEPTFWTSYLYLWFGSALPLSYFGAWLGVTKKHAAGKQSIKLHTKAHV